MGFFKREHLTDEQKLTKKQQELTQRQINELRRVGRGNAMGRVLGAFGNAFPRGIRSPDSLVRNIHLYTPGRGRRKTILK